MKTHTIGHIGLLGTVAVSLSVAGCAMAAQPKTSKAKPVVGKVHTTAQAQMAKKSSSKAQLPVLQWQERSDWINVKTDVTPKAVGNGKADDTKAIQAALSNAKSGSTIYFPPGTYKITSMLVLGDDARLNGVNLIGSGRTTRIVWGGEKGGYMLKVNGIPQAQYRGIVLDGKNSAAIGFYAFNTRAFGTGILFRDMGFENCTRAGVHYAPQGGGKGYDHYASAETTYKNCLFVHNGHGLLSYSFNDYDHTFTGCEFRDNTIGIFFGHGNFYVRDTHFERSATADIVAKKPEHGCSVRRSTSVGSKQFINYSSGVSPITVQNCHVSDWTSEEAAMTLITANVLLIDNSFTNNNHAGPAIAEKPRFYQLLSGNRIAGKTTKLFSRAPKHAITIPNAVTLGPSLQATQHFLTDNVAIPGKVFDAKVDFGAKGDGKTDDTAAAQKTIDAAKAYGKGAIAYFPASHYIITKTLKVSGSNYYVGGAGRGTQLIWKGAKGGTTVQVRDPHNITLLDISVGQTDFNRNSVNTADIMQTGSGIATRVTYRGVRVYGKYADSPKKGIFLRNLGSKDVVLIDQFQGNIHSENSAAATILADTSYEGTISLSGEGKNRDGFFGVMTRLATGRPYELIVKNNQSGVFSDFYTESGHDGLMLSGKDSDPLGRITIHFPKAGFNVTKKDKGKPAPRVITGKNFAGDVFIMSSQFYTQPKDMLFDLQGKRPQNLYVAGSFFYKATPKLLQNSAATRLHLLSNYNVKSTLTKSDAGQLSPALNDLRRLGSIDLQLNFPWIGS